MFFGTCRRNVRPLNATTGMKTCATATPARRSAKLPFLPTLIGKGNWPPRLPRPPLPLLEWLVDTLRKTSGILPHPCLFQPLPRLVLQWTGPPMPGLPSELLVPSLPCATWSGSQTPPRSALQPTLRRQLLWLLSPPLAAKRRNSALTDAISTALVRATARTDANENLAVRHSRRAAVLGRRSAVANLRPTPRHGVRRAAYWAQRAYENVLVPRAEAAFRRFFY